MSEFDSSSRGQARFGEGLASSRARDLIARAQRLIDTPRPAGGHPLAWHVEALNVGDASVIDTAAIRAVEAASKRLGSR